MQKLKNRGYVRSRCVQPSKVDQEMVTDFTIIPFSSLPGHARGMLETPARTRSLASSPLKPITRLTAIGGMVVVIYGYTRLRLYAFTAIRVYGYTRLLLYAFTTTHVYDYTRLRLYAFT